MLVVSDLGKLPVVEEGLYTAICTGVIDLGIQVNELFNKSNRQVRILFELVGETYEVDGEEHTRQVSRDFTQSLSEKANLRSFLEAWRGKRFTPDELNGFDLNQILNWPGQLQVIHKEGTHGIYAVANAMLPLAKGVKSPKAMNPQICFDMDVPETYTEFELFPEFLRKKISEAKNFGSTGLVYESEDINTDDEPARGVVQTRGMPGTGQPVANSMPVTATRPTGDNRASSTRLEVSPAPAVAPEVTDDGDLSFEYAS